MGAGVSSSIHNRDQKGLLFRALRDGKNVHRKNNLTLEESRLEVQRYRTALQRWVVDANVLNLFPPNNTVHTNAEPLTLQELTLYDRDRDNEETDSFLDQSGRLPAEFAEELLESNWKAKTVERYYLTYRNKSEMVKHIIGFVLPMLSIEDWVPSALVCKNWTLECRAATSSWNGFLYALIQAHLTPLPVSPSLMLEPSFIIEEMDEVEEAVKEAVNEENVDPANSSGLEEKDATEGSKTEEAYQRSSMFEKYDNESKINGESKSTNDKEEEEKDNNQSNKNNDTFRESKDEIDQRSSMFDTYQVEGKNGHLDEATTSVRAASYCSNTNPSIDDGQPSSVHSLPPSPGIDTSVAQQAWSNMGDREIVAAHISTVKRQHNNNNNNGSAHWDWSLPIGWVTFFETMSHFLDNAPSRTSVWASDPHCCHLSANRTCSFSELRRPQTGRDAQIVTFDATNGALDVVSPSSSSASPASASQLLPLPLPLVAAASVDTPAAVHRNAIAPYLSKKYNHTTATTQHPSNRASFSALLISRVGKLLATQCVHFVLEFGATMEHRDIDLFQKFPPIREDYNDQPTKQRKNTYISSLWCISTEDFSICFDLYKAEIYLENDDGPISLWNEYHLRRTRLNLSGNDIVDEMSRELVAHYMAPSNKGTVVSSQLSVERFHQLLLLHWVQGCETTNDGRMDQNQNEYHDGGLKQASKEFFKDRLATLIAQAHKSTEQALRAEKNRIEEEKRAAAAAQAIVEENIRQEQQELKALTEMDRRRRKEEEEKKDGDCTVGEGGSSLRNGSTNEGKTFRDIFQKGGGDEVEDGGGGGGGGGGSGTKMDMGEEANTNGWAYLEKEEKEEYVEEEELDTPRSNVGVTDGVLEGTLGIATPRE